MSFFTISKTKFKDNSMAYLHSHEYYELYFQLEGARTYFCDNKYYDLTSNVLIVTRPNVLHKFENGPYQRVLISADANLFSNTQIEFLNTLDKKTLINLSPALMPSIIKTLDEIIDIENTVSEDKQILISLKLGLLFHQIHQAEIGTGEPTTSLLQDGINYTLSPTVLKIMDYVQKNYNKKISLDDISKEYCLSKTWLCKCFLQANHITIFEYKTMCQINEAKRLLRATNLSIEKIALTVGFSSSRHFSMTFKKHLTTTPLNWRKQLRPMK